jgi:hypothetical protein
MSNKGRRGAAAGARAVVEIAFGYVLIRLIFMQPCARARSLR